MADHLREDGSASLVFPDRAEDVGLDLRIRVDAEILGHEPVRPAAPGDDAHERQVRHVLHRGEDEGGSAGGQKRVHRWGEWDGNARG